MRNMRVLPMVITLLPLAGCVRTWNTRSAGPPPMIPTVPVAMRLVAPEARDQDDMCIWRCASRPEQSLIIASDKKAGRIFVYDLSGRALQTIPAGHPGNIDVRYGFPLGGRPVDIAVFNERDDRSLRAYAIRPDRKLERIDDGQMSTGENYGGCLYRSAKTGRFYAITTSAAGNVEQHELFDDGAGRIGSRRVRTLTIGKCEAALADDETGILYIAEEARGVIAFAAEPDEPAMAKLVAPVGRDGLVGDVEGLAIGRLADGGKALIVSDQGKSEFRLYRCGGDYAHLGTFKVAGASETDGLDVTTAPLGESFPHGLFACHSSQKPQCPVLLVRWETIEPLRAEQPTTGASKEHNFYSK